MPRFKQNSRVPLRFKLFSLLSSTLGAKYEVLQLKQSPGGTMFKEQVCIVTLSYAADTTS